MRPLAAVAALSEPSALSDRFARFADARWQPGDPWPIPPISTASVEFDVGSYSAARMAEILNHSCGAGTATVAPGRNNVLILLP